MFYIVMFQFFSLGAVASLTQHGKPSAVCIILFPRHFSTLCAPGMSAGVEVWQMFAEKCYWLG